MRVELQPAYVLHTRPYRDTSMLVELLTRDQGRVAVVAKGVRAAKSRRRALLNPFTGLLASYQGRGGLKLLTSIEPDGASFALHGAALYCGFYMNELLLRVLAETDAYPFLFQNYQATLMALSREAPLEPLLRRFELSVLEELGYGINLTTDATHGTPLIADAHYQFDSEHGFTQVVSSSIPPPGVQVFYSGRDLLAIAADDFSQAETRLAAKRLTRAALQPLLGNKPLKSRELFRSSR
ncbi:DNA repair protein RecO [Marinimicrobium sp. ABcell2]|uniref:DNA repair protein RecO n=1 Tax=Marinimicrobium sp. ABcell2 TaxID=3069751 RepID=UPI0027B121DA|nr:DNA repair protein RecO [Marinimicrobium sp. ABcell2]MDQ2075389.1 DNA repair protein RecO [Marinimicrobium sp. ABcell2]